MGNMYTNITLRGPDLDSVLAYLNAQGIVAYVITSQEGYVVVYDQASDSQNEAVITARTEQFSRHFDCAALAVLNHDDDLLMYWLYENGTPIDKYNSAPGWSTGEDMPPVGGDAATLCRVFGIDPAKASEIETILRTSSDYTGPFPFRLELLFNVTDYLSSEERMKEWVRQLLGLESLDNKAELEALIQRAQSHIDYSCAIDRHEALVKALHLPDCVPGFGFDYLDRGDVPDGLTSDDLRRTGPVN